jgi:membrane-associated phospholipid phosphatase
MMNRLTLASLALALACAPATAYAQTAPQTPPDPGYFMPPTTISSAVTVARPVPDTSAIVHLHLVNPPAANPDINFNEPNPWYKTDWGVAGIGVVATGFAAIFDHGINQFAQTKISYTIRNKIALRAADIMDYTPLVFAGLTMIQSPISDPKLAHASSIAFTAAANVTLITLGMKYVIGRDRPTGPNSNPFVFQPFDAAHSTFSIGGVIPGLGKPTASFPSGHTALAFALITPYAELYHAPWLYALPVAVGISRVVAVDSHYTSDVVGGAFVGWLTADLTRRFFPNSDYGLMLFGDGRTMEVGIHGKF